MRTFILSLLIIFTAGAAMAADDMTFPSDSRIKLLMYDESDVYTIVTRYGYQTNIVFGVGEEIQTISVGDRSLWQLIPNNNRLFIRPMEEDVITNMTILTNKHSYQFDLKSVAADKSKGNIYVAKFVYKDDEKPKADAKVDDYTLPPVASKTAPVPAGAKQPVFPNYNYTYSGPDELAPLQVYDDGNATFIRYREVSTPLPIAAMVDVSGQETAVPLSQKGDTLVIESIAPELVIKSAGGAVHIYNEMLNPNPRP